MAYLKSSYIQAYPVVNRNMEVSGDLYARHTSEESLTSIVNKLVNTDGFVITSQDDFGEVDKPFKFNIHGYYFTVLPYANDEEEVYKSSVEVILEALKDYGVTLKVNDVIYASIKLTRRGNTENGWLELAGCDTTGETGNTKEPEDYFYSSVNLTTSPMPASEGWYCIPLFQYVGESSPFAWKFGCYIKNDYYLKFYGNSFDVDGGDLDS